MLARSFHPDGCPLCGIGENPNGRRPVTSRRQMGWVREVSCRICGRFSYDIDAEKYLVTHPSRKYLSAFIRSHLPIEPWFDGSWPDAAPLIALEPNTAQELLSKLHNHSVSEKQLLFLQRLVRESPTPGKRFGVWPDLDYPVNWSIDPDEFWFHIRALQDKGLIKCEEDPRPEGTVLLLELTTAGWDTANGASRTGAASELAFVAMSFSQAMRPVYDKGIKVAIAQAGFKPLRTDTELDIGQIDARIMTEIRRSRFVVADVTEQRQGVYFEAGFALGLGIPVFWSVRRDEVDAVHFDTRQYNHIVWSSPEELAQELTTRITAIVGLGRGETPSAA